MFFSWKLSDTQRKYSVTEIELLAIVVTLKEFKGMLWGQNKKVFADPANLMRDALRLNLGPSVRMEVLAGRVRAQDCLYQRHTQHRGRCSLAARV